MRNVFRSALILCLGLSSLAFVYPVDNTAEEENETITWYSWEEAIELQNQLQKRISAVQ